MANTSEKVFTINRWLGLNQSEGGDTQLRMGEASNCRNWRITKDGYLQKRPGTLTVVNMSGAYTVKGLWSGYVNKVHMLLGACNGKLYSYISAAGEWQTDELGSVSTTGSVHIFGFGGKAYILANNQYKVWNGTTLSDVVGYIPLVMISAPPAGGGESLEAINRLNGKRRMWFSPDGTATVFQLPEKGQYMTSIDSVTSLSGGTLPTYTVSTDNGTVTFTEAPARGTNSIEVSWTMSTNYRQQVTNMKYSELYNDAQDTRVFLYGDGSNKAIYSEVDYDGNPTAEYFPDLNEIAIGDANTPITAMVRHFSTLVCFKSSSAYSIRYGSITLEDGTVTAAFYSNPVNREIGCEALGQACIVQNSPRTLHGRDVYEWKSTSSKTGTLSDDERQAKAISDRINSMLEMFSIPNCVCFDDNTEQEYYICQGGNCLVHNYNVDAWSYYTGLDIVCMTRHGDKLVFGTSDGKIKQISYEYTSDDGSSIDCYFESGSMDFGKSFMRKYASNVWMGIAPENTTKFDFTVITDRSDGLAEKSIDQSMSVFDFSDVDFDKMNFGPDIRPKIHRFKIKAKKFVYYKLIIKSDNSDAHATVVAFNVRVRYSGWAK